MKRNLLLFTTFWGCLFIIALLNGCAGSSYVSETTGAVYFKSGDFIIYQLRYRDTPASLAKQFLGDPAKDWLIEEANENVRFEPDNYIVIPLRPRNKGGISDQGFQTVPILCYHRFGNHCDSPLCIPEDVFEQQMAFLKTNGYRVISPEQIIAYLEYRAPLPKKSVMITVDDGYRSFYDTAYPILKKYGFTATLFVYTNFVEVSSKAITWNQLRELKANGFTIGSHTIAHSDLSKQNDTESDEAYQNRLRHELVDSKTIIDKKLNQNTFFFAYPFGRSNPAAIQMTKQAGYKLAVTVNRGGNAFFANSFMLRRDQILKRDMATFRARLQTFHSLLLR